MSSLCSTVSSHRTRSIPFATFFITLGSSHESALLHGARLSIEEKFYRSDPSAGPPYFIAPGFNVLRCAAALLFGSVAKFRLVMTEGSTNFG